VVQHAVVRAVAESAAHPEVVLAERHRQHVLELEVVLRERDGVPEVHSEPGDAVADANRG